MNNNQCTQKMHYTLPMFDQEALVVLDAPVKKLISIILPIFNEQDNILVIYACLTDIFSTLLVAYEYEILFIDDGSVDSSWRIIETLAQQDLAVRAVRFSRNFGHQVALKAGYDTARGEAVITMDADMQHPPVTIVDMIKKWQVGADIVYVRRTNRNDGFLKKMSAIVYYRLLDAMSDVKIPRHVADFRLIDKKVLQILKNKKDKALYWRGMVAWTGFSHDFVDCAYADRHAGKTGYTWRKMMRLAFDGMTGFSLFPLKIAAYVGMFVVASGSAMFAYITVDAVVYSVPYPLFKWLVTIIYIFMGVQFLLLWLIGEYIGRIYEQQKDRPSYIVSQTLNIAQKD